MTVAVLLVVRIGARATMPLVALGLLAAAAGVALALRVRPAVGQSRWARWRSVVARELRDGLLARRAWPAIALASALVVAGHAVTFLIAARAAGAAPPSQLLALALLVLLAGALPNVGGWGPREGVTVGVLRRRPGRVSRGRHCGRLRRDGVRRQPAGRRRAPGGLGTAQPVGAVARVAAPGQALVLARRDGPQMPDRPYTMLSCTACRSTATSGTGRRASRCPTRRTSTGSTRCAHPATRSWSARSPCAPTTPAARTLAGPPRRAQGPRARIVSDEDHRDGPGGPRRALELLHHRRDREARLHLQCPRARGRARLGPVATIVDGGRRVRMRRLEDLADRGVERLMVEGGGVVHPVPGRRPRRRAATRRCPLLRRRLERPALRARRALPVERPAARDARQGAPDRRRGAAALRPLTVRDE